MPGISLPFHGPIRGRELVASPPVQVPPDLDRDGVEQFRQRMEQILNVLTIEAEQWAESGDRREGQQRIFRSGARRSRDSLT